VPPRLDWQVGPPGQRPEAFDPAALIDPGAPAAPAPNSAEPRRRARVPIIVALYLMVLAAAAVIGFGLGRWSELYSLARGRVENQLAIERLAWRDADVGLFASTLDPGAPEAWRRRLARDFATLAPLPFAARIDAIAFQTASLVRVEVAVEFPLGDDDEVRYYRWVNGNWYRTLAP